MKKLKANEMKDIVAGVCGPRCVCVCAFTDAGMDVHEAIEFCTDLFGPGSP